MRCSSTANVRKAPRVSYRLDARLIWFGPADGLSTAPRHGHRKSGSQTQKQKKVASQQSLVYYLLFCRGRNSEVSPTDIYSAWAKQCPIATLLHQKDGYLSPATFVNRTLPAWRSFLCAPSQQSPTSSGCRIQVFLRGCLLSSLPCLRPPQLRWRSVLLWPLRQTDGAGTGNSLRAKVSTVAVLGGVAGDGLVDPAQSPL